MKKKMSETAYRASRICRVLGNPTAYSILKLILKKKRKPGELAEQLGLSLSVISHTLRNLRNVDLIRYEINGREKIYRLKDRTILDICKRLEKLVGRLRDKKF